MWAIFPCPGCHTLVHRDLHQCPRCGFDLENMRDQLAALASGARVIVRASGQPEHFIICPARKSDQEQLGQEELHCPECHEVVRRGMVRCRKCKTFLPPFRQE